MNFLVALQAMTEVDKRFPKGIPLLEAEKDMQITVRACFL